jgi:hypothetical protein
MAQFGHVQRVTKEVGGKVCTFRSLLEYRYAVWLQLQKEQGIILEWWYEDPECLLQLSTKYFGNKKLYLPDFTVQMLDKSYELHETKGYFSPKDYTKLFLATQQYKNPITLIFASLNDHSKNSKIRAQYARAKKLEPHLKRIIWKADRDIFKAIKHLFEI